MGNGGNALAGISQSTWGYSTYAWDTYLEGPGLQPFDGAENCGIRSDKRGRTSGTS